VVLTASDAVTPTITTTMRVINSIHNDSSNAWSDTLITVTTSFTDLNVLVLFVTDATNGSHAVFVN
jgi:hypothetical protein